MSVRVMSWVWEFSRSEGTDRLVLLAIADQARDDGSNAYPSVRLLADKTKVSERTVQRSIKALQLLGEITVEANAGRAGTNVYAVVMHPRQIVTPVNLSPPLSESHPRQRDGVTSGVEGVTPVSSGGDTHVTRTVLNPKNHPSSSDPKSTADPRFVEFWQTYPRRVGKPDAFKAFAKALRREPGSVIIAGAARFRDDPNRSDEFTPHPATWLNRDGWSDDPIPARGSAARRDYDDPAGWARN